MFQAIYAARVEMEGCVVVRYIVVGSRAAPTNKLPIIKYNST
jgi:hypothetical protein